MLRYERYQIALITLGLIATIMLGVFLYRELFPEYRIYQNIYAQLEEFRSTYSGEPAPEFKKGVKQIVFERADRGPEKIDRCISCHLAEQLPHFSPTKISYDINGNIARDADGTPIQIPNEDYIWTKLDQKITELRDRQVNQQLEAAEVNAREKEASRLEALKQVQIGDLTYDVTKTLRMHPLISKETRPLQYHPMDEYGCTSCHSGNGRALTATKAHGPVFDGTYEIEDLGPTPEFIERDAVNDPDFSAIFNYKPSDVLLFQTTPILAGNLIQGSCIQCHKQSSTALQGLSESINRLAGQRQKDANAIQEGFENEKAALLALYKLKQNLLQQGYTDTINELKKKIGDPFLLPKTHESLRAQLTFMEKAKTEKVALHEIHQRLLGMVGSEEALLQLENILDKNADSTALNTFLNDEQNLSQAKGSLFNKWHLINLDKSLLQHVQDAQHSFDQTANDQSVMSAMASDVDWLTQNYRRGQQLYISQACYACHKIAGMARGGVGPDLTYAGENYPWYLKEKMVWPQGSLPTSTMPNMTLDEVELEDLMTFLLAQHGPTKAISEAEYKQAVQLWEGGHKVAWEKPLPPSEVRNLRESMIIFATEGCAACHRLKGFESNVGFSIEKNEKISFENLYEEKEWFRNLFPEEMRGSAIVEAIENNGDEIDRRLADHVRDNSILEEIDQKYPEGIAAFYSNFRFALRAKNHHYNEMAKQASSSEEKNKALEALEQWKARVHRVFMMYIQEYGFGRLIGPRPNWAGVYRSDQWLMEHFRNPTGHVPRSIMPIFPFDDSKFYALTYMLDVLGKRNRQDLHEEWKVFGFNPEEAIEALCSQCHGPFLLGNGPVATWIYPLPKNLRNPQFLRNLTRAHVLDSILHGVKGTPMPPWNETPKDKDHYDGIPVLSKEQATQIVDWLFSSIPGAKVNKGAQDVPKWNYSTKEVIDEMRREGTALKEETSLTESNYFDALPRILPGEEKEGYYIKKKFYTQENISKGRDLFLLNCAVCHGNDADGSGERASIMIEAKPRMLTNLDWLHTRDDLWLLRSIKYGVPGTAMTPWGDQTSSSQRLELVIFIRSLSAEKERRTVLADALYKNFVEEIIQIDNVRAADYSAIADLQKSYEELQKQLRLEQEKSREGAVALYQKQFEIEDQLTQRKKTDDLLVNIRKILESERDFYFNIGNDMISMNIDPPTWNMFIALLNLNNTRFSTHEGKLTYSNPKEKMELIDRLTQQISTELNQEIQEVKKNKAAVEAKAPSSEKDLELHTLSARLTNYLKLNNKLLSGIQEQKHKWQEIKRLYLQFESTNSQKTK